jgi:VanZ family protein
LSDLVANGSRRRAWAKRAAIVWGLFLFALTSWPSPPSVPIVSAIPDFDKLVHFSLYGVEAFLIYSAVRWPGRAGFSLARMLAIVGLMAVWGVADETHQFWIPGRSMEAGDVAGDVIGATAGAAVASVVSGRSSRRRFSPAT